MRRVPLVGPVGLVTSPAGYAPPNPFATALKNQWRDLIRKRHRKQRDVRLESELISELASSGDVLHDEWAEAIDSEWALQCLQTAHTRMVENAPDREKAQNLWRTMLHFDTPPRPMTDNQRQRLCSFRRRFRESFGEAVKSGLVDPADLPDECVYLLKLALRVYHPGNERNAEHELIND